jgi:hypothetical protein
MTKEELATTDPSVELAILGEGDYSVPVEDAEAQAKEIAYRILSAEDENAIYEQAATTSARDITGIPLTIRNVRWQKSRMTEGGPTVFALIEAERLDNGKVELITCGSRNVMAQLYRAAQLGKLPSETPLKFIENETSAGFAALWLTKA